MSTPVFSFAIVHPPQAVSLNKKNQSSFFLRNQQEGFFDSLRKAKKQNDRDGMVSLARAYTASSRFINSEQRLDKKLLEFMYFINDVSPENFNENVRASFQSIFNTTAAQYIKSAAFEKASVAISESLVAAAIDNTVNTRVKKLLSDLARTLQLAQQITHAEPLNKQLLSNIKMILPAGIFPLPLGTTNLQEHRNKVAEARKKGTEEKQKTMARLAQDLKDYHSSIDELTNIFDSKEEAEPVNNSAAVKHKPGFFLPKKSALKISAATKSVIKKIGLNTEDVDIVKTVSSLEKLAGKTSTEINSFIGKTTQLFRIGINDIVLPDFDLPILETGESHVRVPGACPPPPITATSNARPITTNGRHDVRVLGIADLLIVEQDLSRYELGEISHIENVLKKELRDRKQKVTDITEETVTTESEETDSKQNNLSSTERFELQSEAQRVINESTGTTAGATVSASYGFVDTTANFNYTSNNSLSETQRSASNFARETISRAVSKLEKRNLERRVRRTYKEVEETSRHTFDNKTGEDNISGVYKFVDKIYNAQILNYGKRLMLEFIIPEPAAFLRHAMMMKPTDLTVEKPEEPGYCSGYGKVFSPLKVQDITASSYLLWAAKYGVEDIVPPPPELQIIGKAFSKDGQDLKKETNSDTEYNIYWHAESLLIDIKNGYLPVQAKVLADFTYVDVADANSENKNQKITVQVAEKQVTFKPRLYNPSQANTYDPNDGDNFAEINVTGTDTYGLPVTISSWGVMAFGLTLTVLCRRTPEALASWQIKTYNAVMAAYKDQLITYNNAVETARIRSGFNEIRGVNPFINRETEKTELKKGCITLLTGQHFEGFDAMNRNVGENRYPEIDFEQAGEEGRFISFFEQAFEWNNMTYVFYPYFWAKKDQWAMLSQLSDTDPLFVKFLQAGSCRVNLPVRIGFEDNMLNYISNNILWSSEGNFINSETGEEVDLMHISLLEELKSELNNMNTDSTGKLDVTKNSDLVSGVDIEFTMHDKNKRIIIGGSTYIIKHIIDAVTVQLRSPYTGETETNVAFSFGAKLYGESWEVKVPTNLVKIDNF